MLTWLRSRLQLPGVARAARYAQGMAGAVAGIIFTLGSVFTVPIKGFLSGYGPVITAFLASLVTFFYRLRMDYRASDPQAPAVKLQLKERQRNLSTSLIACEFQKDMDKARGFLQKHHINDADIERVAHWSMNSDDDLQEVWEKLFKATECNLDKYPVSFIQGLMAVSSHFIECILLQVYANPELLTFSVITPSNCVILSMISVLALAQGILQFYDTKQAYEHPDTAATLCNTVLHAYTDYTPSTTRLLGYGTMAEV